MNGDLYIADAYMELLVVGAEGGLATRVVTQAQGVPFAFPNGLDINDENGLVYFTDSSSRYQMRNYLSVRLSGDTTGRLMSYDPQSKQVDVLLKNLSFPKGVALSQNGDFLLIAETTSCRIMRYWPRTPEAGTFEVFAQLPGFSDNIKRSPRRGIHSKRKKRGGYPAATDMNGFHDFIKKSLHVEVTKAQLSNKVRRLKKKYSNNAARKKYNPTKPHEQNVFELSKIWGGGGSRASVSSPKSNGAAKSNGKATLASPAAPKEGSRKSEIGGKSSVSVRSSEMIRFGMRSLPDESLDLVVMKGLDLLPDAKKAELDAMWKKLHIDELELFVEKNQLMNEQVKLVLEKLKSSDH
ncbi:probable transcription factor At1g11510 [Morus notabilis]|nr:probable transcription factor At1g11510 [Morus notabilis]